MRRAVIAILLLLVIAVVAAGAATLLALEGQEVVVLRTRSPDGQLHRTRVWIAEEKDVCWIEAADPERDFYRDLTEDPDVEIERGGEIHLYRATPLPGEEGHRRVRALLREKYGWADRWVGLLVDTSSSVAVRLDPRP